MIRAVVDTNVLVSALISPFGNEALVVLAVARGRVQPCLTDAILQEYAGVLARPKFAFSTDEILSLMELMQARGELSVPPATPFHSPDLGGAKFLACAAAGAAEFLVTGNKRHFPQARYGPTRIVSAGELRDRIALEI